MGSGSSTGIGARGCTEYTDESWMKGEEKGDVSVWVARVPIALWLGVHHCIVVDGIDGAWRVYEWSSGHGCNGRKDLRMYKSKRINPITDSTSLQNPMGFRETNLLTDPTDRHYFLFTC